MFASELKNALQNRTKFLKWKMVLLSLNQVEMAVLTLYILTTKLLVIKTLLNKLNLTFLLSPFRSNIQNIDTKVYLHYF